MMEAGNKELKKEATVETGPLLLKVILIDL